MSFRVQIALFGAGLVAVTLVIFSLLVYGLASTGLGATRDRDLIRRAQRVEAFVSAADPESLTPSAGARSLAPVDVADSPDTFVELLDANGEALWSTAVLNGSPLPIPPELLSTAERQGNVLATVTMQPGEAVRLHVRPWNRPDLGSSGYIVIGQSARGPQSSLAGVRGFLILSGGLTLVAALIAIWLVAGRALRPLQLVANTAEDIRLTGNLGQRLPDARGWDELNRLSRAFNGMLERLADAQGRLTGALEAQRRFVADASHELRTPLTTIRTNAGLLLGRPDLTATDRQAALHDIDSESERMSRLVHELLMLARADAGQHLERTTLDLASLVQEVGRQAQQLHPTLHISVETNPAHVSANADAIKQLLWILLDNAARFSGNGGHIRLALGVLAQPGKDGLAEIRVVDDGPGIPPASLGQIFDRFYQGDLARGASGSGLGLAIARWIVEEHRGCIMAHNGVDRGAVFVVELPVAATLNQDLPKER
ncbi:MAG: HAMP domain-containing sensor histidine kinase [Chloroflexota bacterium]